MKYLITVTDVLDVDIAPNNPGLKRVCLEALMEHMTCLRGPYDLTTYVEVSEIVCQACHGWGFIVGGLPGGLANPENKVERCDECGRFDNDVEAQGLADEIRAFARTLNV